MVAPRRLGVALAVAVLALVVSECGGNVPVGSPCSHPSDCEAGSTCVYGPGVGKPVCAATCDMDAGDACAAYGASCNRQTVFCCFNYPQGCSCAGAYVCL